MTKEECDHCPRMTTRRFVVLSECGYHDSRVCLGCLKDSQRTITFTSPAMFYKNKSYTIPLELVIPDFPFTEVIGTYCPYTKETTISNNKA